MHSALPMPARIRLQAFLNKLFRLADTGQRTALGAQTVADSATAVAGKHLIAPLAAMVPEYF
jgi:hypothetical protein